MPESLQILSNRNQPECSVRAIYVDSDSANQLAVEQQYTTMVPSSGFIGMMVIIWPSNGIEQHASAHSVIFSQ
jgi:hypothetical protein